MTSEDASATLLREIAANTREIATWLQFAHGPTLKQKLESLLDSPAKLIAYQHSDGNHSTRALAELAGVGDKTIREWWREWSSQDIVEETELEGRFQKCFDLRKLGIAVPKSGAQK